MRFCWKCSKPLSFTNVRIYNPEISKEILLKIWKSENIELYCCDCYAEKIYKKNYKKMYKNYYKKIIDYSTQTTLMDFVKNRLGGDKN